MYTLNNTIKLAASSLTFPWEDCRRCFRLKVIEGIVRPDRPMPKIFNMLDSHQKEALDGQRTEILGDPHLKPGYFEAGNLWVESEPLPIPGHDTFVILRGFTDTMARFDDGTFGIPDLKTSLVKDEFIPLYSRQLHSYALALENPAPNRPFLSPITTLGLICFQPEMLVPADPPPHMAEMMHPAWVAMPRDDDGFFHFLGEVLDVLESPEPPDPSPGCAWCRYRGSAAA